MGKQQRTQAVVWIVIASFFGQVAFADVVPGDSSTKASPVKVNKEVVPGDSSTKNEKIEVNKEVVPGDSSTKQEPIDVSKEVVPGDSSTKQKPIEVNKEVVPGDSSTKQKPIDVNKEVVPGDSSTKTKPVDVSKEVVPGDSSTRKGPDSPVAINPFVGEIAVGASLLITYGPQIIALAMSVATIAAAINQIKNTGKNSAGMVKGVGEKLKAMLQALLGPLAVSNGMAKEGVEGVSAELLKTAKFINTSLSTPVDQVQANIEKNLAMSLDIEKLAQRGQSLSESMMKMAAENDKELKQVVAGGEIQVLRDGALLVSKRLNKQAELSSGAFHQTLTNSKMSTTAIKGLQAKIEQAVSSSGKSSEEITLSELGLSGAEMSKQLIEARKYMVQSKTVLTEADKSTPGLHTEILGLLGSIKKDLENYASSQGVDADQLARMIAAEKTKSSQSSKNASFSMEKTTSSKKPAVRLDEEIRFMVDDLTKLNERASTKPQTAASVKTEKSASQPMFETQKPAGEDEREVLFTKKLAAYKSFISVMSQDPGNKRAIEEARAQFELSDREYQDSFKK